MPTPEERFSRLVGEAQRDSRLPSLTAAVFRGGKVEWSEAIGVGDVEAGTQAAVDMQYAVASITKTFTATAVMQLRDEGKLDLDDPLERHLPDVPHGGQSRLCRGGILAPRPTDPVGLRAAEQTHPRRPAQ